jgi:hypothetical protein
MVVVRLFYLLHGEQNARRSVQKKVFLHSIKEVAEDNEDFNLIYSVSFSVIGSWQVFRRKLCSLHINYLYS